MRAIARLLLPLTLSMSAHAALAADRTDACGTIGQATLPGMSIVSAVHENAGKLTLDDASLDVSKLPAFCRISGVLKPRERSEIHFEAWLPDNWNSRYLQAGNGGFAGSISYPGLVAGLQNGFAVTNSDGGHRSSGAEMGWAVGGTEAIEDFGNRALYETAKASKALIASYYGEAAHHAYFSGCSDGGRESLMSVQRYPEQFDGWVVGAPENDFTRELATELVLTQTSRLAKGALTSQQLARVAAQARKTCDSADGLADGLIADPRLCKPKLEDLACKGSGDAGCLTPDALASLRASYDGLPKTAEHAALSGLAMAIGTEDDAGGWATWMSDVDSKGPGWHEPYAQEYFGAYIYEDPKLDLSTLDPAKAFADAFAKASRFVDAVDPDLAKQRAAGKKILQYQGWSDVGIPVHASIDYYAEVQEKLGSPVDDFYRLFLAPGMGHCGGGIGPNHFGGTADAVTPFDPQRNILAALVDWVEKGKAPDTIVATKYANDDPTSADIIQRPLCAFPKTARYKGTGPASDAASFECQ